eukprot:gene9225-1511_t
MSQPGQGSTAKALFLQSAVIALPGLLYSWNPNLFGDDLKIHVIFKCTTIAALIVFTLAYKAHLRNLSFPLLGALFFSMIGDAALVYEELFVVGLSSFLIGHLFYIFAFAGGFTLSVIPVLSSSLLALAALGILMPSMLENHVDLVIPVSLYLVVIILILITATCGSHHHVRIATTGAWMFAISDFLIAINQFVTAVPHSHQVINCLYFVAQPLLVLSLFPSLKQKRRTD